jgi:hypothetical protein
MVPAAQTSSFGLLPQLFGLYEALRSILGSDVATYALIMIPIALCYGAARSIPQGIALPGSRSAKVVWMIVLMLTGFVVVVMAETFSYELREAFGLRRHANLTALLASSLVPLSFGWLILALVSGSIMYWNLWRNAEAATTQVLARFA